MKIAWLFPGQGSQAVGMGRDLYEGSAAARAVLDEADRTLGFALTRLMFEGPADQLQLTINTQPAIVAASLAALAAFQEAVQAAGGEAGPARPDLVAGHSVGEYAALVACGAATAATGLRLVGERARLMHEAGQARPGGMTAVLGLERPAVEEACRRARARVEGSYVDVANHNAETQVIVAGDPAGLDVAAALCKEAGARRCLPLPVSAAFHSAAMVPAAEPLRSAVQRAEIRDPAVALVANVTARPLVDAAQLRDELSTQVVKPVLWADTMRTMIDSGARAFLEFGPGQVLANLVQRVDQSLVAMSVGDVASARAAAAWWTTGRERSGD